MNGDDEMLSYSNTTDRENERNGNNEKENYDLNNFLSTGKSGIQKSLKLSSDLKGLLKPALSDTRKSDMVLLDTELLSPLGGTAELFQRGSNTEINPRGGVKDFVKSMYVSGEKNLPNHIQEDYLNQNFMSAHPTGSYLSGYNNDVTCNLQALTIDRTEGLYYDKFGNY